MPCLCARSTAKLEEAPIAAKIVERNAIRFAALEISGQRHVHALEHGAPQVAQADVVLDEVTLMADAQHISRLTSHQKARDDRPGWFEPSPRDVRLLNGDERRREHASVLSRLHAAPLQNGEQFLRFRPRVRHHVVANAQDVSHHIPDVQIGQRLCV